MARSQDPRRESHRKRRVALRIAATCVGLAPFVLFELVLWAGNWGRVSDAIDPFVGFDAVHPLFTKDPSGERYRIDESRLTFFCPDSFAAEKPAGGFRVFCLGGSTVQGRPYAIETAFARWLQLDLECAEPGRRFEVVNCGGVSYASYRLAPILQEVLRYEPDLVVLYTGHNEFLEDRTYREVKQAPPWIAATHRTMTGLRTYNLLRSLWVRSWGNEMLAAVDGAPRLRGEVDARLDYRGGLDEYRRDPAWRDSVIRHFEFNLRRMVHMARAAGVPLILVNPGSNLGDSPPFKSAHREDLTAAERDEFEDLWTEAGSLDLPEAQRAAILQRALAIDGGHARTHYEHGVRLEAAGRFAAARAAYLRALDEDLCPLRMLPAMHRVLLEVAAQTGAPLVDARELFDRLSANRIPGAEWFVDHVHPTIAGHQRIADALRVEIQRLGLLGSSPGFAERRAHRHREHFASLRPDYYLQARRRLDGLRRWSRGGGFGRPRQEK